jgi:PST family polysaccharide transporter
MFIFLIIVSALITITVFSFSEIIVALVFGTEFTPSVSVLRIYIWSLTGSSLLILINHYLILKNFQKMIIGISLCGVILNVILNIILIPRYGIEGAAWATFFSYVLPVGIFYLIHKKQS